VGRVNRARQRVGVSLSRDLGLFDITMIGVAAMIGAGIFVLTGIAAGEAGPGLLLAFLLNGLITLLTAAAYAELGSSFPQAGGGYVWIREGLSTIFGFLSGWMDWFAHSLACSLYALGFGTYAARLLSLGGLSLLGLPEPQAAILLAICMALLFGYINYLGASETGTVGNIVTLAKIAILAVFVLIGLRAMTNQNWQRHFYPFLPRGLGGIFGAMGLTAIAFQGYEIVAQSGEEVKDPKRNIPRAIFLSVAIVVLIYLAVAFVALGAIDSGDLPTWLYLGEHAEVALVEVAKQLLPGGAAVIIIGGLMSTMSALNATIYSSSRVSFAMGRDRNLPSFFAQIHPKHRTPQWAIAVSTGLVILMVTTLPIKDVASAAGIMFLLLFMMVNVALISLRKKRPDLDRGYKVPWLPFVPLVAIGSQIFLAIYLFRLSPIAWYTTILWIAGGLLFYYAYASRTEAMEELFEIIHEEVVAVKEYSVLIPVADEQQAHMLSILGSAIAKDQDGELFALHVVRVPLQLSLSEGRHFLREGKPLLEEVIRHAKQVDVPVHTMIRMGHDVGKAIIDTAIKRESNLILLGWPGYTESEDKAFGRVIDYISRNPPCDLAVVRFREREELRRILVPTAGGPNASLALELAISQARQYEEQEGIEPTITALYVVREGNEERGKWAGKMLEQAIAPYDYPLETKVVTAPDVVTGILKEAEGYNLVILGATREGLFDQLPLGAIPRRVAEECPKTVIMVKRYQGPVRSWIRRVIIRG